MIRIVLTLIMYLISQVTISQTKFEQGMQQAFQLMQENKLEEAANLFERIGNAEPTNWLPYYNLALLKTRTTFGIKDNAVIEAQLKIATEFVNKADEISPDNSEIYVLKGLMNVAKIASNPMVYGASLSAETTELYKKAIDLDNLNPRAVSGLAEFEMGGARFFKQDLTPYCKKLQESLKLYDNFKPASEFHPNWGKNRVLEVLKSCGESKAIDSETVTITVNVPNVTSDKGTVQFALYNKDNFMLTSLVSKIGKIENGITEVKFEDVKPGLYAIICFHDSNENNKMDFNEQRMPMEDYGVSNNPVLMGPPTFDVAKFTVENKSLDLTIKF
ncbi:MAG: DUF2141 domain-containing protein [Flavobacteriaceae bacterium]|nr:DUF2141 domain-containing protein [Flavobacteriaceae bacterium]